MDRETTPSRRVDIVAPLLMLAAFVVATFPTLLITGDRWLKFDESYSHGYLLLLVSLVLSVRTWLRERPVVGFYPLWLVPFALALIAYALGELLMIQALRQVVLVPLLLGGLVILWGWRQIVPFLIPVGVLFFAIPVWDYMDWPLQLLTTAVNQFMLSFGDIEFEVEGVFIYLIGVGAFEIAGGCSGLRYLLVGMTLSLLYGHLNYYTWRSRFILLAAGVVLALLANWIRVFVIIYMGYITNMETGLIEDHDSFGWWVFAGTLVPLFFLARWLEDRWREQDARERSVGVGTEMPLPSFRRRLLGTGSVVVLPLVIAVFLIPDHVDADGETRNYSLTPLPADSWSPLFQRDLIGWKPRFQRVDWKYENTFFRSDGLEAGQQPDQKAWISLYSYSPQRGAREVIMYGNRLYDGGEWVPDGRFSVDTGDGVTLRGMTLRRRQTETHVHIVFGYYVEGRWETDEIRAKLAQLHGAFNARNDGSALVVGLTCEACDGQEAVSELARELRPKLQAVLDERFGGE